MMQLTALADVIGW